MLPRPSDRDSDLAVLPLGDRQEYSRLLTSSSKDDTQGWGFVANSSYIGLLGSFLGQALPSISTIVSIPKNWTIEE